MNESDRAKERFLRRVVLRAGVEQGVPGRFPCGHVRALRREHLERGESFPYGTSGATLIVCAACGAEKYSE